MVVLLFSLEELNAREMLLTGVGVAFILTLDDLVGALLMTAIDRCA